MYRQLAHFPENIRKKIVRVSLFCVYEKSTDFLTRKQNKIQINK